MAGIGKGDSEACASQDGAIVDCDLAVVAVDQVGDDGQAEACAAEVTGSGLVRATEPLEEAFPVGWGDAVAVVVDVEQDDGASFSDRECDGACGVAECVVEQVAYDLYQACDDNQCFIPRSRTLKLEVPLGVSTRPNFARARGLPGAIVEMNSAAHMKRLIERKTHG